MHWFRHENFPSGGEPAPPVPAQQLTPLSVLTSDFIEPRRAVVVVQANLKRGRSQLRPGLTQVKQLQPVRCQTCDPGMRAQDSSESGLCRETDDDRSGAGPSAQTKSQPGPVMTRMWSKFPATAGPGRRRAGEERWEDGKERDRKRMSTKRGK